MKIIGEFTPLADLELYADVQYGILGFSGNEIAIRDHNGSFTFLKFYDNVVNHSKESTAKQTQVGGDHYLKMKIQPLEFAMANELDACQTKIIKYICRDKSSKLEDLEKARHVLDYYIDWVKSNV